MKTVKRMPLSARRTSIPVFCALLALAAGGAALRAQAPNPTSASNPFYGSVVAHPATDATLKLSLDDAVRLGLSSNLGLKQAENEEKSIQGQKNQAIQKFLPTITLSGDLGVHQQELYYGREWGCRE